MIDTIVDVTFDMSPPFRFRIPGSDKVWQLPHLDDLPLSIRGRIGTPSKVIQAATKAGRKPPESALEALGEAQLALFDTFTPGLSDLMSAPALAAIMKSWGTHSGIDMGESQASADSSPITQGQSTTSYSDSGTVSGGSEPDAPNGQTSESSSSIPALTQP